ncbi:MAG TPA: GNAT family N-acetyltransferase [Thermoplasmata archaeon]|nr:GNAT family N-acetyltransferase [Thermoplasmata archaeon]
MSADAVPGAPVPPPPAPIRPPRTKVRIRRARYRDVAALVRLYLDRSEASWHGYHPFPSRSFLLGPIYFGLVTYQYLVGWAMRRLPRLLVVLVVAEIEGSGEVAGSGTLRGVIHRNEEPRVRFGFLVGERFQGLGIGKQLLWGLAETGLDLGYKWGVGVVFRSDAKAISAISKAGFMFSPTAYRDPRAPEETNYSTVADLAEMVRRARETAAPG